MNDISNLIDSSLLPGISTLGYFRPSSEMLLVNDRYFLLLSYDPREKLTVLFGFHNFNYAPQLMKSRDIDIYGQGKHYATLMESASLDPSDFSYFCGEHNAKGIRAPSFDKVISEIVETLPKVQQALNNYKQRDGQTLRVRPPLL